MQVVPDLQMVLCHRVAGSGAVAGALLSENACARRCVCIVDAVCRLISVDEVSQRS